MAFMTGFASVPQIMTTVAAPTTAVAATTLVVRSLTVSGSTPDMLFVVNWPSLDTGLILGTPYCATAGTVSLPIYNVTASPVTPAAQTLLLMGL